MKIREEKPLFQLFFLKDDEDQSVDVDEVEEIDFREVEKRLNRGESVFITRVQAVNYLPQDNGTLNRNNLSKLKGGERKYRFDNSIY